MNFNKAFIVQYNNELGKWVLDFKPTGETASGECYIMKFNMYPEWASVNDRTVTVNYEVNIVK